MGCYSGVSLPHTVEHTSQILSQIGYCHSNTTLNQSPRVILYSGITYSIVIQNYISLHSLNRIPLQSQTLNHTEFKVGASVIFAVVDIVVILFINQMKNFWKSSRRGLHLALCVLSEYV